MPPISNAVTVSRRIQFAAGHRVYGHESKCAFPHGHNYVAIFHARAPELDELGRVIDFGVLKQRIGAWIDQYWDHCFLVYEHDAELIRALCNLPESGQRVVTLPVNPTAENLALILLRELCPRVLQGTGVEVFKVELWETENCKAEAAL